MKKVTMRDAVAIHEAGQILLESIDDFGGTQAEHKARRFFQHGIRKMMRKFRLEHAQAVAAAIDNQEITGEFFEPELDPD